MSPDLADHAYGLCLAVLLEPSLAEKAARDALRRGSWTTTAVLAHARHTALADGAKRAGTGGTGGTGGSVGPRGTHPKAAGGSADSTVGGPGDLANADLTAVARRLTASRPPLERAIVDLHGRHGLDRLHFARTLGLDSTAAAARMASVGETWAATLDPALLARLGPGDCEGLAAILAGLGSSTEADGTEGGPGSSHAADSAEARRPAMTVDALLAAVPAVVGHVEGCAVCRDRLRAMISVADLVTGIPLETAPEAVRVILQYRDRRRRRRRPAPLPPPVEPERGRRTRRRLLVAGTVVGALAAVVAAGTAVADHLSRESNNDRILALTRLPAINALSVDRATVIVPGGTFVLLNLSRRPLRWQANSPVSWLSVDPGSGSLAPGGQTRLGIRIEGSPPGGQAAVTVSITGDDGSATAVRATTAGAGLPDVATSISQCVITATAEAPQGIANVALHWQPVPPPRPAGTGTGTTLKLVPRSMDPSAPPPTTSPAGPPAPSEEHVVAMTKGDTGYVAVLPAHSVPIEWWVEAVDNGGDQVDTVIQLLGPGPCS